MCGIAGWVTGTAARPDRDVVVAMTRALAHRGPDVEGVEMVGPAGLGHRRLSVIDLSAASNQPMWDSTRRYLLVFNGEIYNFRELRSELQSLGHAFTTAGDVEVLLEALKEWGQAALNRLLGMFAFALWDRQGETLLLARDRLGKKPLFFALLRDGGIAFASEPRALNAHPGVSGSIHPAALASYLRLNYVPCNDSLFQGVKGLPPASCAVFDLSRGLRVSRYWDLASRFHDKRAFKSEGDAAEELAALIDDAVRIRLVSDVPLGTFLSGGVDSSTILASMLQQREPSTVHTFSSGFLEDSFDESALAERLARQFGSVHRTQTLDTRVVDLLPAAMATAAEPLADTSALPVFFLSQFTRSHVTVALSGDGGDECFAGYETYVADRLQRMARIVPRAWRAALPALVDSVLPVDHKKVGWSEKSRRFSAALAFDPPRAHASWRNVFADGDIAQVMRDEWRAQLTAHSEQRLFEEYFGAHFEEVRGCHPLDQASYVDIKTWLADDILVKADRMSMAHSLEVRCPLLDHRIVEFAAQLPPAFKLRGFSKKHVLKLSQKNRLPDWVLKRPKPGFNAPVSQWLLGPLRELCEETLFSESMRGWFEAGAVQRLWVDHQAMRRDNGLKLFGLLTVGLFIESCSGPRRQPIVRDADRALHS
jgi:asparagine synthase (glutamine-hydrolysing)